MSEPLAASAFTASIGVNVHMDYFDTAYANSGVALADLQYLGITRVRDELPAPDAVSMAPYTLLAANGIRFDFLMPSYSPAMAAIVADLDTVVRLHPGAVVAVEGPNEVNLQPVRYNGQGGVTAAIALQKDLFTAVHADPNLAGVPVFALTLGGASASQEQALGNLSAAADVGNAHVYPDAGDPPGPNWMGPWLATQDIPTAAKPIVMTEWGYATLDNPAAAGVTEAVQAKYDLDALFDAQKAGVQQTFLYELLDERSDPSNANVQLHFGLFHADGTPKLAATAIHDLTSILADTTAASPAGSLNYAITGLTNAGGSSLLMQKGNGAFDLAVWAEPATFNTATFTDHAAPHDAVTVALGAVYATVEVFDPMAGTAPISTLHAASSVSLDITDHPLIVEVEPAAAPPPPPGAALIRVPFQPRTPPAPTPPAPTPPAPPQTIRIASNEVRTTIAISNATITSKSGTHAIFITGTADTLTATGGVETVQALEGGNTLTTGNANDTIAFAGGHNTVDAGGGTNTLYDGGRGNTIVLPESGRGIDLVHGNVFANGDVFDLRDMLQVTTWSGVTNSDLGDYIHIRTAGHGADSIVSVARTGSFADGRHDVAHFYGSGQISLATLLSHALTT